jgi:hypothetical protein
MKISVTFKGGLFDHTDVSGTPEAAANYNKSRFRSFETLPGNWPHHLSTCSHFRPVTPPPSLSLKIKFCDYYFRAGLLPPHLPVRV